MRTHETADTTPLNRGFTVAINGSDGNRFLTANGQIGTKMTNTRMKYLRVTMPDGSKWDVPTTVIETNYLNHYNDIDPECEISNADLIDWAENNMNWDDVENFARRAVPPDSVDLHEGWVNGDKEIVYR